MKVLLIDDEPNVAKAVQGMLAANHPSVQVVGVCRNVPDAVIAIKQHKPHLILLDIEMPVYNGFDLFKFFTPDEVFFHTVFVTGYSQYAIQAFEVAALDYLLKPLHPEHLKRAIEKAESRTPSDQEDEQKSISTLIANRNRWEKMALPTSDGLVIVNLANILYIEANRSYTTVFMQNEKPLLISKNMTFYEKLEEEPNFMRIHRSYLANLDNVVRVTKSDGGFVTFSNGTEIPIGPDKKQKLLDWLVNRGNVPQNNT